MIKVLCEIYEGLGVILVACMLTTMLLDLIWGIVPSLAYGSYVFQPIDVCGIAFVFYFGGSIPVGWMDWRTWR